MDPEFKAFIHAVAPGCTTQTQPKDNLLARGKKSFIAGYDLFSDAVAAIGAFRCDFRPFQRLREVCAKCEPKQSIGYHGLI